MPKANLISSEDQYAPRALLFADPGPHRADAAKAIELSGGSLAAALELNSVADRLDCQARADAILVELAGAEREVVGPTLRRVERFVEANDCMAIINVPLLMVDCASAACESERLSLLCEADMADRIAALSLAWNAPALNFADSASEMDSLRLKRLADEVNRIARALSTLSVTGDHGQFAPVSQTTHPFQPGNVRDVQSLFMAEPAELGAPVLPPAQEIRTMLRLRRLRESFFDPGLFADPAWDMLLDLLAARIEGDQVAVSSLCIAAAVPPTTALRWIKTMTDSGLLERHADPMDGRRIFIRLSDNAAEALGRYFAAARRHEMRAI